jgi:hypothetical protein
MNLRLNDRRQALAPELSKWQIYEAKLRQFHERKAEYLRTCISCLRASLDSIQDKVRLGVSMALFCVKFSCQQPLKCRAGMSLE